MNKDYKENKIFEAQVTAVHKERYQIFGEFGEAYGKLKKSEYYSGDELFPTVGDNVLVEYMDTGDSRIIKTLKRKTEFLRLDPSSCGYREQAVAANFDYVFIMQSLNQDMNIKRLERYLTLGWQSGATPVVILTKADLCDNADQYIVSAKVAAIGADVVAVSAKNGFGIEQLKKYLVNGKTAVFLGSSGVGKSSLVNALAGKDIMAVNGIREDDDKGRHTTTHRQMIRLEGGGKIIDTPGMRELGMWDVTEGIGQSFSDVESYFSNCKFSDCRHGNEPGCAVRAAIEKGELSEERWNNYIKLKREAKYSEDKGQYLREMQAKHKSVNKNIRALKKHRRNEG